MLSGLKNFIITFCVSVLIFGLIAYFVVHAVSASLSGAATDPVSPDDTSATTTASDITSADTQEPNPPDLQGESFTILLVGTDYQSVFEDYDSATVNRGNTGFPIKPRVIHADSILLIRVDKETRSYVFTSLPSNMRVLVDGAYTTLGDLYAEKGMDFMRRKVSALTGYNVDYYAAVSVEAFAKIIDKVGGVYYTVPTDMYYEDPAEQEKGAVIDLKAGSKTLTGKEAAAMLRYVQYADGDRSRMDLAVSFAQTVLKKITDPSYISKLDSLYLDISPLLETNLTINALTANAELIAAYPEFHTVELTYPGSTVTQDGQTYFEPNTSEAVNMFRSYR